MQQARRPSLGWASVLTAIVVSCQSTAPIVPTPVSSAPTPQVDGPTPGAPSVATTTASPSTPAGDRPLVVRAGEAYGFGLALAGLRSNDDAQFLESLVTSTLYRYNAEIEALPDVAAEPCAVEDAGLTIMCRLREAWFHDGTPLTAEDVAFSFELVSAVGHPALAGRFESVSAPDRRTVRFVLPRTDPEFLTESLAFQTIVSRAAYEVAYADVAEAARRLPSEAEELADGIRERADARLMSDEGAPDCADELSDLAPLLEAAPALLPPDEQVLSRLPWFDDGSCVRALWTADIISGAATARSTTGVAAVAEAYLAVHLRVPRLGSGPFRVAREVPGSEIELEAFDRYHHGRAVLDRILVRVIPDESQAIAELQRGAVDMLIPQAFDPGVDAVRYAALRDAPGITIAEFPEPAYVALMFNVRSGRLFEQVELRQALRLCLDKPALVDAATGGAGTPLEGPLLPIHWAYQPDLAAPERDVAGARALIESLGWRPDHDGVYMRDGRRLETEIWVRADRQDRVHFVELVAERARDCGMALRPGLLDFQALGAMSVLEPHVPPGRTEPFDLVFAGWSNSFEPHDAFDVFISQNIPVSSAGEPSNYIGYSNPRFDALFEEAGRTYDQRERARLYRELQSILAADQPYVFAWAFWMRAYFTSELRSLDGPLNLHSPLWNWQPERLTVGP